MKYCVLYPEAKNVHLVKDVGMIAYKLNRLHNVDSFIACYNNDKYDYLESEVKGLKINFIEKKHSHFVNVFKYLKKEAKNIDVLQIFHVTLKSVVYAFLYKFFNRRGTIFLKLDCSNALVLKLENLKLVEKIILNAYLKRVDIIGVEQEEIFKKLKKILFKYKDKLLNVSNGLDFDNPIFKEDINYKDKENVVITVGRIGSPEKSMNTLMEAFENIDKTIRANWKLVFIGPIEESFKNYITEFFSKCTDAKKYIEFKGPIYDRTLLFNEYKKAKIFCLTSEYESFGFSLIEAGAFGDVIVSTDVGIASEIIKNSNGKIIPFKDSKALTDVLCGIMQDNNLENKGKETEKIVKGKYSWNKITEILYTKIIEIRGKKIDE
ncbi:glycosyl transferase [Clostridium acetobutylicum]|nr:glycosyl transferase [Clostridium acetobutylicum]